jgi:hypothetical protein
VRGLGAGDAGGGILRERVGWMLPGLHYGVRLRRLVHLVFVNVLAACRVRVQWAEGARRVNFSCVACGTEVADMAVACSKCGNPLRSDGPSVFALVLCAVCFVAGLGIFFTAHTVMHEGVGATVGLAGVAWLAALRASWPIKGMTKRVAQKGPES